MKIIYLACTIVYYEYEQKETMLSEATHDLHVCRSRVVQEVQHQLDLPYLYTTFSAWRNSVQGQWKPLSLIK